MYLILTSHKTQLNYNCRTQEQYSLVSSFQFLLHVPWFELRRMKYINLWDQKYLKTWSMMFFENIYILSTLIYYISSYIFYCLRCKMLGLLCLISLCTGGDGWVRWCSHSTLTTAQLYWGVQHQLISQTAVSCFN